MIQIEGLLQNICVPFGDHDPLAQVTIKASPPGLDGGNLDGMRFRWWR